MAKKKEAVATERDYSVIREPIVTEKTTLGSEHSQVTFRVSMDATKPEIKKAIESLFSVKVKKVNTLVTKGKMKRFKGVLGKRNDYKKAVITLENGQTIDTGIAL